jgi:anti-sigma B factor antagonist
MRHPILEVHREPDDRRVVLAVSGEVDMASVGVLREALEGAASEAREVWLDLSAVEFMDSTGLTALLRGHHAIGDGLTIVCPGVGPVRRAIDVSGLNDVLHVVTSRDGGG